MIIIESFSHLNLPTQNLQKSVDFYTQFLDFETVEQNADSALLTFDSLNIRLKQGGDSITSKTPLISFIMDIDDFTEALQELDENEINVVKGPFEITGGESVYIQDPGGNLLELYYRE